MVKEVSRLFNVFVLTQAMLLLLFYLCSPTFSMGNSQISWHCKLVDRELGGRRRI